MNRAPSTCYNYAVDGKLRAVRQYIVVTTVEPKRHGVPVRSVMLVGGVFTVAVRRPRPVPMDRVVRAIYSVENAAASGDVHRSAEHPGKTHKQRDKEHLAPSSIELESAYPTP